MRSWIPNADPNEVDQIAAMLGAEWSDQKPATNATEDKWTAETLGEVAEFFGVQLQTVKEWRTGANPMPGEQGAWPLSQIARWRVNRADAAQGVTSDGQQALKRTKLELENAARMLRLRRDSGELVSRVHAKAKVEQMFHELRGRLEAIPEEMIAAVPPDMQADVLADWRDKVSSLLRQLSQRENEDG